MKNLFGLVIAGALLCCSTANASVNCDVKQVTGFYQIDQQLVFFKGKSQEVGSVCQIVEDITINYSYQQTLSEDELAALPEQERLMGIAAAYAEYSFKSDYRMPEDREVVYAVQTQDVKTDRIEARNRIESDDPAADVQCSRFSMGETEYTNCYATGQVDWGWYLGTFVGPGKYGMSFTRHWTGQTRALVPRYGCTAFPSFRCRIVGWIYTPWSSEYTWETGGEFDFAF